MVTMVTWILSCFDFQPIREAHLGSPINLWVTWGISTTLDWLVSLLGSPFSTPRGLSMKSGMRAWGLQPSMVGADQSLYLGREGQKPASLPC